RAAADSGPMPLICSPMHKRHNLGVTFPGSVVQGRERMNLETKWLEDFVALAMTRSFSKAAERRFVTQPAFSRRIRSLEEVVGLTLVHRSRTPVQLTEAGQLFLVTARNVVEQLPGLREFHGCAA